MRCLRFFIDENERRRLRTEAQARGRKRRRDGANSFAKKKKQQPSQASIFASLGIGLADDESWRRYVRFMVIAGYLREKAKLAPGDHGEHSTEDDDHPPRITEIVPTVCPPASRPIINLAQLAKPSVAALLRQHDLGPIVELASRTETDAVIEPALVIKTAAMLAKLGDFFPDSADKVKDTPYQFDDGGFARYNVCHRNVMKDIATDFVEAAKLGYVGATLVHEMREF